MADPRISPDAGPARRWTAERWARAGITIQFLALVRTLAEVYRLRHVAGGRMEFAQAQPFIAGGLIAAVLCWAAVTLYFFRRFRATVAVAALTVVVLLVYKLAVLGA